MGLLVKIFGGVPGSQNTVEASGSVTRIITEADQNTFGLSAKDLETIMTNHMGRKPTDIFLKSPTPWGDLYVVYNLQQVQSTIEIKSAKVLDVANDTIVVKTQDYTNDSSVPTTIRTSIEQEVQNTVSSTWTSNHEIGVDQNINYSIVIASGDTSFSYVHSWGTSKTISETVTLKSSTEVELQLQPQQGASVELRATIGIMEVEVDYEASLSGSTVLNFNPRHEGHHFWFPSIVNVMKRAGLKNPITATEKIRVSYYFNTQVIIRDKATGKILQHLI